MSTNEYKEDFNEFASLFEKKINNFNIMNATSGNESLSIQKDKLVELYNIAKTSYDSLCESYSSNMNNKQKELADTFVQTLQYMLYQISLKKDVISYEKLSAYILALFGENSSLDALLKELQELVIIYLNLDEYTAETAESAQMFRNLKVKTEEYNYTKYEYTNLYNDLQTAVNKLNTWIKLYDENIYIYNDENDESKKIIDQIDLDFELDFSINTPSSSTQPYPEYSELYRIHSIFTSNGITNEDYTEDEEKYNYSSLMSNIASIYSNIKTKETAIQTLKKIIKVDQQYTKDGNVVKLGPIPEKEVLKTKIENTISAISKMLKEFIDNYSLLPETYSLTDMNAEGHSDIIAESESEVDGKVLHGGAKSFFVQSFNKNRFCAYMGSVDRGGYVGQKAQLYVYIPVKTDGSRLGKTFNLSAPLLKINNNEFKNNPKNVVFGLFNKWDYTGDYLIENDGAEDDKGKPLSEDEYVVKQAYFRFGGILSSTDLDWNKTKQSCRLKCDDESGWTSGTISKKGTFVINNVALSALFDGETTTKDFSLYSESKFSDSMNISFNIINSSTGKKYIYSGEGLSYDADFTNEQNQIYNELATYYKGTMKLSDPDQSSNSSAVSASDYGSNKDVVLKITRSSSGDDYYSIKLYLDPESNTNANVYEDSGNDPSVYLPMLASNIFIESAKVSHKIQLTGPSLETTSALLDLEKLMTDELDPFDETKYSNILNRFESAKSNLLSSLLAIINDMNVIIQTATMVETIYSTWDSLYTKTYVESITTEIAKIQSTISTYLTDGASYDVTELYNGVFINKIKNSVESITTTIYDNISDLCECEIMLHKYDTKLCNVMQKSKNQLDFNSPLSVFYNSITGNSQTLETMISSGQSIKTYNLNYTYTDWINLYDTLPNNTKDSHQYFLETGTLQYLYVISQIYKLINIDEEINPSFNVINSFYRTLLLRALSEHITNKYYCGYTELDDNGNTVSYPGLFITDVVDSVSSYNSTLDHIDSSFLNFNKYYLNPYITDLFPDMEQFNTININDIDSTVLTQDIENMSKSLIYKSILNTNPSVIKEYLTNVYNFIHNGQKLNVREILFSIGLNKVLTELNEENDIPSNYKINIDSDNFMTDIRYILKYRTFINTKSNDPIKDLMNFNQSIDINAIVEEINLNQTSEKIPVEKINEIAKYIQNAINPDINGSYEFQYRYTNSNEDTITDNVVINYITLPKLLQNNSSLYSITSIIEI